MKKIVLTTITVCAFAAMASCHEKPVTYEQLPDAAKTYIMNNFPSDKVALATQDDDAIRPDYEVKLASGIEVEFDYAGALKKVASRDGISAELVPEAIRNYISAHYPNAGYLEYEIGRRTYEVKLTNHLEFKFNSNFHLMEIDD